MIIEKDPLRCVFELAYRQVMDSGDKGMCRHGDEKPFRDQISPVITRLVGIGYPLGQALKKENESHRLERNAAIKELLGAINYLAMAVIYLIDESHDVR